MLQQPNEKNRDLIVNINGKLVHRDQAGVSPFDSAVQGGDAVWEGLRLYDGRIFKLTEHLDRLRGSAQALAFAVIPSHEEIIREIRRTLEANRMTDGVHIRLTLTRGVKYTSGMDPRLKHGRPDADRPRRVQGPRLRQKRRHARHQLRPPLPAGLPRPQDPSLQPYPVDSGEDPGQRRRGRRRPDARPARLRRRDQRHARLRRPARRGADQPGGLPGGDHARVVLDLCRRNGIPWREKDLSLTEVYRADEMFCTGTMGEIAPVLRVDGRTIGAGSPGPVTGRLQELFRQCVREEGTPVVA